MAQSSGLRTGFDGLGRRIEEFRDEGYGVWESGAYGAGFKGLGFGSTWETMFDQGKVWLDGFAGIMFGNHGVVLLVAFGA